MKVNIPPNMTTKMNHIEDIKLNIIGVTGDGTLEKIQTGKTIYGKGEPMNHMVTPADDKYFSLAKEHKSECLFQ
jgi:hypothetical protein